MGVAAIQVGPGVRVFVEVGVNVAVGVRVTVFVGKVVGIGPVISKLNASTSLADKPHVLPSK